MTKPKYASAEERREARSEKAARQMTAQWERQRQESGQEIGYFGIHRRIRKVRGRAADHQCSCGRQARHWAHIHDTDPADLQNYKAMCQFCHYSYDDVTGRGKKTLGPEGRRAAALKAWETKRSRR